MNLELNKTYRCRNGAKMKIIRGERTMSGNYDRFSGETDDPPGSKMLIAYYPDGRPLDACYYGYTTVESIGGDPPELYFSLKVQYGATETVSESKLTRHANRLYEESQMICGPEADAKRLLAAAALRMIELAKIKPPAHKPGGVTYTPHQGDRIMCQPETNSKAEADRAARELATMLNADLGIDVTPILLRLWLTERWDSVAKLAHKIHGA